ncbi:MAG TPA: hypothetical protein VM165_12665 [Planctomycetaceae bacterium]|nr:hypothetical protein [Planctomycetaceae bacterium]
MATSWKEIADSFRKAVRDFRLKMIDGFTPNAKQVAEVTGPLGMSVQELFAPVELVDQRRGYVAAIARADAMQPALDEANAVFADALADYDRIEAENVKRLNEAREKMNAANNARDRIAYDQRSMRQEGAEGQKRTADPAIVGEIDRLTADLQRWQDRLRDLGVAKAPGMEGFMIRDIDRQTEELSKLITKADAEVRELQARMMLPESVPLD